MTATPACRRPRPIALAGVQDAHVGGETGIIRRQGEAEIIAARGRTARRSVETATPPTRLGGHDEH